MSEKVFNVSQDHILKNYKITSCLEAKPKTCIILFEAVWRRFKIPCNKYVNPPSAVRPEDVFTLEVIIEIQKWLSNIRWISLDCILSTCKTSRFQKTTGCYHAYIIGPLRFSITRISIYTQHVGDISIKQEHINPLISCCTIIPLKSV